MRRLVERVIFISNGFPVKPRLVIVPQNVAESAEPQTQVKLDEVKTSSLLTTTAVASEAPVELNK